MKRHAGGALPDGAHIMLLDARGKGMTSEDFAETLGSLRDVGTKDLAFVIGGPDGLAPLPGKKAGRSLAFGPQTWPHLLARALLLEQVYRAMTILAGHPYHRACLPPSVCQLAFRSGSRLALASPHFLNHIERCWRVAMGHHAHGNQRHRPG